MPGFVSISLMIFLHSFSMISFDLMAFLLVSLGFNKRLQRYRRDTMHTSFFAVLVQVMIHPCC